MSLLTAQTERLVQFAAVTTLLRGNVGWTFVDALQTACIIESSPVKLSDEQFRDEARCLGAGSAAIKRMNQLKNEWYRSEDAKRG